MELFGHCFQIPLPIVTKHELGLPFSRRNLPVKSGTNTSTIFLVIVVTDRQTHKTTPVKTYSLAFAGRTSFNNWLILVSVMYKCHTAAGRMSDLTLSLPDQKIHYHQKQWKTANTAYLHLSFTPGLNLPLSQILPPLVSLLPPGLPPRTFACTVSPELLGFWFLFFSLFFVSGLCARLSWPSRQLLSARKTTVSYRIVS